MSLDYNKIFDENKILEGERIFLRPFTLKDKRDVYEYAGSEKVTKYLTWEKINSLEKAESIILDIYRRRKGIFAIEHKAEQKCIGCIDLRIESSDCKASFGYVLNESYWNKGYMTEALKMILDLAFNKLKLNRLEATHYAGNEGSGRVMEKCGMIYEGTVREETLIKGIYHDVKHYGILKRDYKGKG